MASPLLRYSLCRRAQRSHLVWPGRGGFLQSRHLVGPPPAVFSSRAMARSMFFACLALARRLASSFRRRCRCFSAQVSHLVWPGIAGLEQSLHFPVSLAIRICSPTELPPVLLPFGGLASGPLVLPALFGRLLGIRGTGPFDSGVFDGFRKVGCGVCSRGFPGTTPVSGFQEDGS